jgi:hypothetical protein
MRNQSEGFFLKIFGWRPARRFAVVRRLCAGGLNSEFGKRSAPLAWNDLIWRNHKN